MEEKENSNIELVDNIKKILYKDLKITLEDHEINKIHRIGKKRIDDTKARPVLISFVTERKKIEVMKNKKELQNVYITEDYPKNVLNKRKELQAQVAEERKKGNIVYIKYDKLVTSKGGKYINNKKRMLSTSPVDEGQPRKQQIVHQSKAGRNAFEVMRRGSNSSPSSSKAVSMDNSA